MDTRLLLGVLVALLGTALANPSWSVTVEYGKNVILSCNDTSAPPTTDVVRNRWMLPDLRIVDKGWTDDDGRRGVIDDGKRFNITMLSDRDFGIYHCMFEKTDGTYFVVKRGVNVGGPYYGNLWDKYRMSVIIGGSAAGGFAAVMILICLVYKFRWRPPVEEDQYKSPPTNGQIDGYGVAHVPSDTKDDIERIPMAQYHTGNEKNGDAPVPAQTETAQLTNEVKVKDNSSYVYDNPAMKITDPDKLTQL
ncbi:unnamed protein product [Owenia fusiformis]|uniref:Uncharacterized protein n=1 Tax=Owenia fusiformis TaxID=6347 RepID=A0A8J1XKT0_OWEFU|nr:unnamed protein product [Owenia fusiformis]